MLLLAALLPLLVQAPQDDRPAAVESSWVQYLAQRPFHAGALERLLERVAELGGREQVLAAFEHLRAADPHDPAPVIVLARLAAQAGRGDEALATLSALDLAGPDLPTLRARVALACGRLARAREEAEQALAASGLRADQRRELHELVAVTHLLEDDRPAAAATWSRLAQETPDDVLLQLDVARALARLRFDRTAFDQYARVLDLAGNDSQVRPRALTELGDLHAGRGEVDRAAELWHRADALLFRGHWLADGLRARLIDLHRRAGRLDDLIAGWRARVDAAPRELGAIEGLAGALEAAGRLGQAAALLDEAAQAFSGDVDLVLRRARLARRRGDAPTEIAALQQAIALAPVDPTLDFELADALARGGRLDAARERFRDHAAAAPDDAGLRKRIADALAAAGHPAAAREVLERAVRDLPGEFDLRLDLVARLRGDGEHAAALRALEEAAAAGPWIPEDLDRLADVHEAMGDRAGAAALLARACARGFDARRSLRLSELLGRLGRRDEAQAGLREVLDSARDGPLRDRAAHAWVGLLPAGEARRRALREEEALISAGATSPAPFLLVAELRRRSGDHVGARAALFDLLRVLPDDLGTRRALVVELEAAGDLTGALEQVRGLQRRSPAGARGFELDATRLLIGLGRGEEALARLEDLARTSGANAAALRDLAAGLERLARPDRALFWLERALALEPGHVPTRRRAASLACYLQLDDEALHHLERAYFGAAPAARADIAEELDGLLDDGQRRARFLAGLRGRAEAGPLERAPAHLAAELCLLRGDGQGCLAALASTLGLDPSDPEGLRLRARAHGLAGNHGLAADDLLVLREIGGVDRAAVDQDLIDALLDARRSDEALAVAAQAADPRAAAGRFARRGLREDAARLLEDALRRGAADASAWREVAGLRRRVGQRAAATRALEQLLERAPADGAAWRELAELRHELEDAPGAREAATRFLDLAPDWPGAERWFHERGMGEVHLALRAAQALRPGADLAAIGGSIDELLRRRPGAAVALEAVDRLAARPPPDGVTSGDWSHHLGRWRQACLERDMRLARARLKTVRGELLQGGGDVARWREYSSLLPLSIKTWNQDWELLERGLARHAHDRLLVEAIATHAAEQGRHALAAQAWGRLAGWIAAHGGDAGARAESWGAHRVEVRRQLPMEILRELTEARLDTLARPSYDHAAVARAAESSPLDAREVGLRHGVALALSGREAEGHAVLRALEPADPIALAAWVRSARAWAAVGAAQEVTRVYGILRAGEAVLARDPDFAGYDGWRAALGGYWPEAARFLERVGRAVEAYDLLRDAQEFDAARSLLLRRDLFSAAAAAYAERAARSRPPDTDALLKRAEVLDLDGRYRPAAEAWVALAEARGGDPAPLGRALRSAERAGDRRLAVALLRRRLDARRTFAGGDGAGRSVMPTGEEPPADAGADRLALVGHLVALDEVEAVLEVLGQLVPGNLRGQQLDQLCQLFLSDERLESRRDVLEALRAIAPANVALLGQYTGVLIEAGDLDAAEVALDAFPEPQRARGTIARRRKQIDRARGGLRPPPAARD